MKKQSTLIFIIVSLLSISLSTITFTVIHPASQPQPQASTNQFTPASSPTETTKPSLPLPQGRQVYRIQYKALSPKISEAIIDPVDVRVGDTQTMSVTVSDDEAPIASVSAAIETDHDTKIYSLTLNSGTPSNGTWTGSWTVHDTHSKTYHTTFTATNTLGESKDITLTWTDPCTPPAGGDWTLDANCSISGVHGVDNGDFILNNASYTLTLQAGATFVWNAGYSIQITDGAIAIADGAQLKKTNLWMTDADADNYPANVTMVSSDTSPGAGYRRRMSLTTYETIDCNESDDTKWQNLTGYADVDGDTFTSDSPQQICSGASLPAGYGSTPGTDCYDSNANAKPGQANWFTTHRGDGSFDYNCDEATSHQYSANTHSGTGNSTCGCSVPGGVNGVLDYECGHTSGYTGCWQGNGQGGESWCEQGNGWWCSTTIGNNCNACTNICADYGGPVGVFVVGTVTQGCR